MPYPDSFPDLLQHVASHSKHQSQENYENYSDYMGKFGRDVLHGEIAPTIAYCMPAHFQFSLVSESGNVRAISDIIGDIPADIISDIECNIPYDFVAAVPPHYMFGCILLTSATRPLLTFFPDDINQGNVDFRCNIYTIDNPIRLHLGRLMCRGGSLQ